MINIDWGVITSLMAIIASAAAVILAWRKAPHENRNIQADTDVKVTDAALALIEPMQKRIDELEKGRERDKARMAEMDRRITELECELKDERNEKAEVIDGANKLAHQVESLGGNPVYKPPARPSAKPGSVN